MEDYRTKAQSLPRHMQPGILRWIEDGVMPGNFLCAVLENDLLDAALHADMVNRARMCDFALYLHHYAPAGSHGSREAVETWHAMGGLNGIRAQAPVEEEA